MSAKTKVQPVKHFPSDDPAGADKVLLKAGEVLVRMLENAVVRATGHSVELWDGPNGARAVVEQVLQEQHVPNKRFGEIVNPRTVAEAMGVISIPKPKKRLRK